MRCLYLLILLVLFAQEASASCADVRKWIKNGGYGLADPYGAIKEGCHLDSAFIPASTIKILTGMAALHYLGPDFHFRTRLYLDKANALYIQGMGDPMLVSEDVEQVVEHLKDIGLQGISALFIDSSAYVLESLPPGSESSDNPYDAPVTACAVNFNSLPVAVGPKGQVYSSEAQTPFIPLMKEAVQGTEEGKYRLNICTGGCRQEQVAARYTAELFQAFLRQKNIQVSGRLGLKKVPDNARLIYEYINPRSLEEMIRLMFRSSSNFIANQLFLSFGAARYGYPATWKKGQQAAREFLLSILGAKARGIIMVDGAGLSRENRISAKQMLAVLHVFSPQKFLLSKIGGVLSKSGTMEGVYNYAGYLHDGSAYVILLNQTKNSRFKVLEFLSRKE